PTIKLHCLTAALLLAAQTQVQAKGLAPHFGISYVYAIATSVIHDLIDLLAASGFKKGDMVYYVRTGRNNMADGGMNVPNSDTGGIMPGFVISDHDGRIVAKHLESKLFKIGSGEYEHREVTVENHNVHKKITATTGDYSYGNDPVYNFCTFPSIVYILAGIASIAISSDANSANGGYGIPAGLITAMDDSLPWSYSGYDNFENAPSNSCRSVKVLGTCVWMSNYLYDDYKPIYWVQFSDIPDLQAPPVEKIIVT
ncbi:hypothetical protein BGX33_000243, partial [Mortierella sp. NVP41]